MPKKIDGLTQKQRRFAQLVASGQTGAASYREAYNTTSKPQAVAQRAYELMQHEGVLREISAINKKKEAAIIRKSIGDRERVLQKLRDFSENATSADNAKIRALELLGKAHGMFKDVSVDESADNLSADDLKRELQAKLASIMKGSEAKN